MAAASKSTTAQPVGVSLGPEQSVVVTSTNVDIDSNIEIDTVGPIDSMEVVVVSATAKTGSPSVVFTLQGFDIGSQTWLDFVSSTALTDAGNRYLLCNPTAAPVTNVVAQRIVRERMRLKIDYTGTPTTDVLNGVTVTVNAD